MPVSVGDEPDQIVARNQAGQQRRVDFEDPTVLYFYPEDATSGCTTEATQFEHEHDSYADAGVEVLGVSSDGGDSHRAFHEAEGLSFDLLADPDGDVGDAFAVERKDDGRYERTTFVLAGGEVKMVYTDVDPDGHAREVLADLLDAGLASLEI